MGGKDEGRSAVEERDGGEGAVEAAEASRGPATATEHPSEQASTADAAPETTGESPLAAAESPAGASAPDAEASGAAGEDRLTGIVEALVFASPEPLSAKMLYRLLDSEPREDVEAAIAALKQKYDQPGGLQLVEVANGLQIVTRPELHDWVRRLFHEHGKQKLSVQALETLAVIAYKQPITAAEIAEIRGVNTSGVLNTLMERRLVKIAGRKAVVGRPFLYATTREFLVRFGLKDLNDLPKVEDMAEILGFDVPLGDPAEAPAQTLPFEEAREEEPAAGPRSKPH